MYKNQKQQKGSKTVQSVIITKGFFHTNNRCTFFSPSSSFRSSSNLKFSQLFQMEKEETMSGLFISNSEANWRSVNAKGKLVNALWWG